MRAKNSKFDLKDLKLSSYKFYVFKLDSCITLNCVQCSSSLILIQLQTTEKWLRKSMSFCHFSQEKGCVIINAKVPTWIFVMISREIEWFNICKTLLQNWFVQKCAHLLQSQENEKDSPYCNLFVWVWPSLANLICLRC